MSQLNCRSTKGAAVHALNPNEDVLPLCRNTRHTANGSTRYGFTDQAVTCRNCLTRMARAGWKTLASGEHAVPVVLWGTSKESYEGYLWQVRLSETAMWIIEVGQGVDIASVDLQGDIFNRRTWRIAASAYGCDAIGWNTSAAEDDGQEKNRDGMKGLNDAPLAMCQMLIDLAPARTERRELARLEAAWDALGEEAQTDREKSVCFDSAADNADLTMVETGVWTRNGGRQTRTSAWYESARSSYQSLLDDGVHAAYRTQSREA